MLSLGTLGFIQPAALLGLVALPTLWWLLRATPPSPRRVVFPPVRFLFGLASSEESAAKTPLWLLVLRFALAAALIVGAAGPVFDQSRLPDGARTSIVVVDNGWAAARNWAAVQSALSHLIDDADRGHRSVILLPTAVSADTDTAGGADVGPLRPSQARLRAQVIAPQPWATDRMAVAARLDAFAANGTLDDARVFWLSDGLAEPPPATKPALFATALEQYGVLTVFAPPSAVLPSILGPADSGKDGADLVLRRTTVRDTGATLLLSADDGQPLARQEVAFDAGATSARIALDLPPAWRAQLARIEIAGENHAGAVFLSDARWQRASVGIARPAGGQDEEPLLAGSYYVSRAVEPFADLQTGSFEQLLDAGLTMIVLIDRGAIAGDLARRADAFVRAGGVLLRFAGPALAAGADEDALLPVRLNGRDRATGGALTWAKPGRLATFTANGPFDGLRPGNDIEVRRQILAEPGAEGEAVVWARLTDGTPLVTGRKEGAGWLVLVHTAADPSWSNLPLSGLFVEMLQRIAALGSSGGAADAARPLPALAIVDGFGRLGAPPPSAAPIAAEQVATLVPGPRHPPGYYGDGSERRAVNLAGALPPPQPLAGQLPDVDVQAYGTLAATDLRPWLLGSAGVLAVLDLAASLVLRGLLPLGPWWRRSSGPATTVGAVVLSLLSIATAPADASPQPANVPAAALDLRLAFIVTGDAGTDAISRRGLQGLSLVLNQRTAVELAQPAGVNPATDELVFYPLVYWPLGGAPIALSPAAVERLKEYRHRGGTIVFDGRARGTTAQSAALRALAHELDLPPLQPAGNDHLLHRAYYLLGELPGRWVGDPVWVDDTRSDVNDGVASVIAGSNDWAGAWAVDDAAKPLLPMAPGGERQRELAYRFGVNVVMYALTGSYKSDQVHLPAILERLQR